MILSTELMQMAMRISVLQKKKKFDSGDIRFVLWSQVFKIWFWRTLKDKGLICRKIREFDLKTIYIRECLLRLLAFELSPLNELNNIHLTNLNLRHMSSPRLLLTTADRTSLVSGGSKLKGYKFAMDAH